MKAYVTKTENEQGEKLRKEFEGIVEWYQEQYKKYNHRFQSEMEMELVKKELFNNTSDYDKLNYTYGFDAIMSPFCIADFLEKHILSTFSYGPENIEGIIQISSTDIGISWFKYHGDAPVVTELLKEYFKINNVGLDIELSVLLEEREIRSNLTHTGTLELCMSIIRYYNVIRKMILFMAVEYENVLPEFQYPKSIACDVQGLFGHFDYSNMKNNTSILVVDSLHDMPKTYLNYLANMPWNIVIDFDSYGGKGGLRAEANLSVTNVRNLDNHTTNNITVRDNYTEWLTCGDYIYPSRNLRKPQLNEMFPIRNYAHPGNPMYLRWFKSRFDDIFKSVKNALNPVSILYIYHDADVLKAMIDRAEEHLNGVSYSVSALYYWNEEKRKAISNDCFSDYIRNEIDYSDKFSIFPSDILSFFSKTMEYYPNRIFDKSVDEKKLPSFDGYKKLNANLQVGLEKYFEIVYTNVGNEEYEVAIDLINSFHRGGIAPWCAYSDDEVVNLIQRDDFMHWISRIKSILGHLPDNSEKKIFRLNHRPGIGGTTMLRLLAWELHQDYPVLIAQDYNKAEVITLLQSLYDYQPKAFVILADDDFDDIDELERDIKVLARPCVLVKAMRTITSHNSSQDFQFTVIRSKAENSLKYKFKKISSLDKIDLQNKDEEYGSFISQDPSMKSPFFIGLYYIEKEFKHLSDYVKQAFKGIYKEEEYKALGYIAFSHIYGNTTLPYVFVNRILGIGRKNYLDINGYAKSIVFLGRVNGGTTAYQSRHRLISQEILNICSQKLFGGNYEDELVKWSENFINDIITEMRRNFNEAYKLILEKIFTRNRINLENGEADFSKLIQEIAISEYKVDILKKLATDAENIAEQFDPNENPTAYMMAAHFYGHLGRLYSKSSTILNYDYAVKYSYKAKKFLEECSGQDYTIYHMYGDAKRLALRDRCKRYIESEIDISHQAYRDLENEVDEILEQYSISDEAGNHVYARTTSVLLLKDYLRFVYQMKHIQSVKEMNLLTDRQMQYKMQIEEFLDALADEDMDEKSRLYCKSLRDDFESGIMYNDYAHMEVYHQNKLDYEILHKGSISSIIMHRSKLIISKVGRYRKILPNGKISYMNIPAKELEKILTLLEQNLEQNIDSSSYRERQKRCKDYKLWMALAKYSTRDISTGIIYAKQWMNLVEIGRMSDPLPYYYLSVLYSLSVLEGNSSDAIHIDDCIKKACSFSNNRIDSVIRLKDILIKGKGMGQLCDVSVMKEIGSLEVYRQIQPIQIIGQFKSVSSKRGNVSVRVPEMWMGRNAKFTVGEKNHLTDDVITHMVSFFGGFCYEGITAINSSVIDMNTEETLLEFINVSVDEETVKTEIASKRNSSMGNLTDKVVDFIPLDRIEISSGKYLIKGTITKGKEAVLAINELPSFKDEFLDIEQYIEKILKLPKLSAICLGVNRRGQYKVSVKKANLTLTDILERLDENADKIDENITCEVMEKEVNSINYKKDELPDIKTTTIITLEKINIEKAYICGVFSYEGKKYQGRITTNISVKQKREAKNRGSIKCKVLQKNTNEYILRAI